MEFAYLHWRHVTYHFSCYVCVFVSWTVMSRCLSYVLTMLWSGYVCIYVSLFVSITSHMGMHICRRLRMKWRVIFFCLIFTDSEVVYGPRVSVWSVYFYKVLHLFAACELKHLQGQHQMTVVSR